MEKLEETKQWAANRFGISPDEVLWYNSGSCYDRICVTTEAAAEIVSKAVEGETVNGGWYHGIPLGNYNKSTDEDGNTYYDVMC